METIDFFKYKVLLAELESIKGTKKPIHDFIKKLNQLSRGFSPYDAETTLQPQTLRYAFMLASKALTYDASINKVKYSIISDINRAVTILIQKNWVTPDNVLESFEFHTIGSVSFSPTSTKQLLLYIPLMETLGALRIRLYCHNIIEFRAFKDSSQATLRYVSNLLGEGTIVHKALGPTDKQVQLGIVEEATQLVEIHNTILKDKQ